MNRAQNLGQKDLTLSVTWMPWQSLVLWICLTLVLGICLNVNFILCLLNFILLIFTYH